MSGRPAFIGKREAQSVIKAAKQQGARRVEFRWGDALAVVHLDDSGDTPIAPDANEWDDAV